MSDRSNNIGQQNNSDDDLSNFSDSTHESILDTDLMHRIAELSSDDDSDEDKITMNNIAKEILLPKSDAYLLPNLTQSHFELELNGRRWYQRSKNFVPKQVSPYYTIIFRIYFQLITWFKSKYGIGFLYSAYRYCTYFFALGIHCCERISLSWSLFICYTHRFVITVDDWVTWLYRDRHDYDPINGLIVTSKSYID